MKPVFLTVYRHVYDYVTEPAVEFIVVIVVMSLLFWSNIIWVLIILKRAELHC